MKKPAPPEGNGLPRVIRILALVLSLGAFPLLASGETTLTYENWAEGFFTQNCTGCHHSNLSGDERNGAPIYFNFDSLEDIRRWTSLIRTVATGNSPAMPPSGGVWQWDRDSLTEWLDAGGPGEQERLVSFPEEADLEILAYSTGWLRFSPPLNGEFNKRSLTVSPDATQPDPRLFEAELLDRTMLLEHLGEDDGAVLHAQVWENPLTGDVRREDYSPPIPLLFRMIAYRIIPPLVEWQETVEVRERQWTGSTAGTPITDTTRTEEWRLVERGWDEIDNGAPLPFRAFKIVLENLTESVTTRMWFMEAAGMVRRETVYPSDEYLREELHEICVFKTDQQLFHPLTNRWRLNRLWIPLVGEEGDEIDPPDLDYEWQYEIRRVGIMAPQGPPTPTPTPTVSPTPSLTPAISPTPTPVLTASPTPVVPPRETPLQADLNGDGRVDWEDLLLFREQWKRSQ